MELQYRRPDGTFVAIVNGYPYHITAGDALYDEAQEIADEMGDTLTFEPAPPEPEPQPISVGLWQARAALRRANLLTQADAAVAASGDGDIAEYWQYATTISEDNAKVKAIATALGLTEVQTHDLFVTAMGIEL